jgi:sulfur-oxidizing protein SoxX
MAGISRFLITLAKAERNSIRLVLMPLLVAVSFLPGPVPAGGLESGKTLVMEKGRGNCLACHVIADGQLAGNIGPPLVGMKARFPDAETLYGQIWDATERNPDSRMPPFGKHGILSAGEIRLIVEYLYTL